MAKQNYSTKQREYLTAFFKNNAGKCFTIDEIMERAKEDNAEIGQTTVYRNLEKLAMDGLIIKHNLPSGSGACFQYLDGCGEKAHCHLYCTGCGSVTHLNCGHIEELTRHIKSEHSFSFDKQKTVFYGQCKNCSTNRQ